MPVASDLGLQMVQFLQVRGLQPSQYLHGITSYSVIGNIVGVPSGGWVFGFDDVRLSWELG